VVRHIAHAGSSVAASRSRDSASAAFLTPPNVLLDKNLSVFL
jgi:hypothetical protein